MPPLQTLGSHQAHLTRGRVRGVRVPDMKKTKEDTAMSSIDNVWELIAYLFRYRTKEILGAIIIVLVAVMLYQNIGYDRVRGFSWRPAAEIKVNK